MRVVNNKKSMKNTFSLKSCHCKDLNLASFRPSMIGIGIVAYTYWPTTSAAFPLSLPWKWGNVATLTGCTAPLVKSKPSNHRDKTGLIYMIIMAYKKPCYLHRLQGLRFHNNFLLIQWKKQKRHRYSHRGDEKTSKYYEFICSFIWNLLPCW